MQTIPYHFKGENINPTTGPQMKTVLPDKRRNYIHHSKQVEEMLYPIFFIYVWTAFELQVQDLCAPQKIQIFSSLRGPERYFGHKQSHQRACVLIGSLTNIRNKTFAENGVEHQKTVNFLQNLENGLMGFDKEFRSPFITIFGKKRLDDAKR